jgi:hypothetical protein
MSPEQNFKGNLVSVNEEGFEQMFVRQACTLLQKRHFAEMADYFAHWRGCHAEYLGAWEWLSTNILAAGCRFDSLFLAFPANWP